MNVCQPSGRGIMAFEKTGRISINGTRPRSVRAARRHAVTLTEILVAIGIIGVLLGLFMPLVSRVHEQARRSIDLANLRQLTAACIQYAQENNDLLPIGRSSSNPNVADDYTWIGYKRCWSVLAARVPGINSIKSCASVREGYPFYDSFGVSIPSNGASSYGNPAYGNSGYGNSNSGGSNSGGSNSGGSNSGNSNSGNSNSGPGNSGSSNSGPGSSGGGSHGGHDDGSQTLASDTYAAVGWIYWGGRDDLYVNGKLQYRSTRRIGQRLTPGSQTLWTCWCWDSANNGGPSVCPHVGTQCISYPNGVVLKPPPTGLGVALDDGSASFVNWADLIIIPQANGYKLYYQP